MSVEEDAPVADVMGTSDEMGSGMDSRDGIESEEFEFTDEYSKSACGISSSDSIVMGG